ncbi:hypothetical protein RUMTOR_01742 [[Ruminococcus] torques ATCC 27756]|uniref:Uncharacterized protein n=1 Tax=[Ruminococcus] torques ATCC 27756 TaxID=411460 RepID=A5KNB8_9FIRM|nr:hypothetical protein RUMTOR_01742 [[Ruminococcus] torques ATCC 27756]
MSIKEIVFDRWGATQMVQDLEGMDLPLFLSDRDIRI